MVGLILIRHAMVEIDPELSAHEWQLSKNGRLQSKQLAQQLPIPPAQLYSSTEAKAEETGYIIAELMGLGCQTAPNLHEHDRTGVPYFPNYAEFEAKVAAFFDHPDQLVFGHETATETLSRFSQAIAALPQDESITAVVTHGTVITLFICHHNPAINHTEFWKKLTLPCAFYLDEAYQLMNAIYT